ncbi:MAG TPA: response regulator [Nannocystaceae bacterium]|nr:response regulator [Nannocystaceae bacterium]
MSRSQPGVDAPMRPLLPALDAVDVWLLEDSATDAEAACRHLAGCRVRVFTDGGSLLEEIERVPIPDVVVLDWELPELPGIEVCRFLRRTHDSLALPIIMVTAHREPDYVVEAFAAGVNDFIVKPYVGAEFVARVQAVTRGARLHAALVDTYARLEHERGLLAESEARYRALSQSGVIGIIETDLSGRLIHANDAYLQLVGKTRAELLSGRAADVERPIDMRAVRELLELGVSSPYEREIVRDDGEVVVVKVAAARLGESERCVGYVLDVTRERQIEADRARLYAAERRARADAELASRMKDEFLAIVSHELRTPLNAVLGWSSILQSRLEQVPEAGKPLEVIQRNARLQAKLIDDILDVSRIISGKVRLDVKELQLAAVIDQALDAVRPAAEAKGLTIVKQLGDGLPTIVGDPDRLQQVVWNLVSNAVKFTPTGGGIVVAARAEPHHVVVDVTDTGSGIAPEHLVSIFERFRQIDSSTTRTQGGLGLGLAIVRHLVEMHGGTVSAQSRGLGQGSTFTARVPIAATTTSSVVARPVAPAPTVARAAPEHPSLVGVLVVVVDDEADSRVFTATALREAGAEVIECSDADSAIAAVEERHPHVLVSDIAMPRRDGFALIEHVRTLPAERGGDTPAIAVTAHAREHDVARCLDAGFDQHLAKPLEAPVLVARVAELKAGRDAARYRVQ